MTNERPIYIQIIEDIKKDILIGKYLANDRIPSVRELANNYKANPNTCMKALQILEDMGLIITNSTNGKFITDNYLLIESMKDDMKKVFLNNILKEAEELKIDKFELAKAIEKGFW